MYAAHTNGSSSKIKRHNQCIGRVVAADSGSSKRRQGEAHVVEGRAGGVARGAGDLGVGRALARGGVLGAVGRGLRDLLGGEVDRVLVAAGLTDLLCTQER